MPMLINEAGLPLKLVVVFTAVMCVLVFGLGFIAATRFLSDGGDLLSTTTLVFLVLVINQALLGLGIALVATYARATLRETLRRPRYHIAARSSESDS
jgi:hypothetical protein